MSNRGESEAGQVINYGEPMGSSTRRTHFPERAARRENHRPDPLVRKSAFACGEAARRGWMVLVWENPYMREIVRARLAQVSP